MKQQTLAMAADQGAGFEICRKRTRRDELLDTMNTIEIRLEQRRGRRRGSGGSLFAEVGRVLQTSGMKLASGTMVDTTLIAARSSTKNKANIRCRNCCTGKSKVSMEIAPMRARKR